MQLTRKLQENNPRQKDGKTLQFAARYLRFSLESNVLPYRRANFSTRPAVSTNFCSPVKNGWQAAQIPILISRRVDLV
jgi:hypothetical protein